MTINKSFLFFKKLFNYYGFIKNCIEPIINKKFDVKNNILASLPNLNYLLIINTFFLRIIFIMILNFR